MSESAVITAEAAESAALLLVDDNPRNIQLLASLLAAEDLDLAYATSGEEALESVENGDFDLILLDVMMPQMDGFETCKRLKANPAAAHIPVIFLTAKTEPEGALEGFASGGVDYVTKPFHGAELLARVNTQLELLRHRRRLAERNAALEREIERRKQTERELWELHQQSRSFLENMRDFACQRDLGGCPSKVNAAGRMLLDTAEDVPPAALCEAWRRLVHPQDLPMLAALFSTHPEGSEYIRIEYRLRVGSDWRWIQALMEAAKRPDGAIHGYYSVERDVTEQKQAEAARIRELEDFDGVTGLRNRNRFIQEARYLLGARPPEAPVALMMLSLDRLGRVRDTLGYSVADLLLQLAAERLRSHLHGNDLLARVGDNEFSILLKDLADYAEAAQVAQRLRHLMRRPYQAEGYTLHVTASLGIASEPTADADAAALLQEAAVATEEAKRRGGDQELHFRAAYSRLAWDHVTLEGDLRLAMGLPDLELHFQPQVRLGDEALVGAEVLIRWNHKDHGLLGPNRFIPLAENSGLIIPLTEEILRRLIGHIRSWEAGGLVVPTMAVNLSGQHFRRPRMAAELAAILAEGRIEPDRLELEITETSVIDDPQQTIGILEELRGLGFQLAIDDFGTGYSSLSYLHQLPVDKVKIDRSFVQGLPADASSRRIVGSIIDLSSGMGLSTIAEGIEQRAQAQFLTERGCRQGQGYLYGRPMGADEFASRLTQPSSIDPSATPREGGP